MGYISKDVEGILLNKKEFIEEVAKRCMVKKYVIEEICNVSSELIAERLIAGDSVELPNIGRFEIREMNSKNFVFSKHDSCIYPGFKVSTSLKNRIKTCHKYQKSI